MMRKFLLSSLLLLGACAQNQGTSTGNPVVALQFKSYTALSASSLTAQSVSNLKMCFKRLRFKPVSGLDQNLDFNLGEVAIVTTGTFLTSVAVPPGSYSRVEFDLDPSCASGKSVQLVNSNGTFSSVDSITIRFDGLLNLNASLNLDLDMQAVVTAMNNVTSNSDIKIRAESVSGSF